MGMTCEAVSLQESVLNPRSSLAEMGASVSGLNLNVSQLNALVRINRITLTKSPVQHVLTCEQGSKIKILLSESHSERDVLYAYVHGFYFRELMRASEDATWDLTEMVSTTLRK